MIHIYVSPIFVDRNLCDAPIFFQKRKLLNFDFFVLLGFKERKRAVKDAKKEKRENKTPKHVKKRKEKVAKMKKK